MKNWIIVIEYERIIGGARLYHAFQPPGLSFPGLWSEYSAGSDQAFSGSHNVLCKRVSSAVLYEGFVRTSGIQPAVYHHTVVTVCFAELFLDVMLPCFVLQQLKIPPDLTGHGLKIQSALFLIRVCRRYYCVVYYSPQGAWLVK